MPESSPNRPVPGEPPNAILTDSRPTSAHGDDREALELHHIQTREDDELDYSDPSASSGEEYRVTTTHRTTSRTSTQERAAGKGPWSRIRRFWCRHVILTVAQKSNRDHFALERTFLAYIRTSTFIAMQGVLIAQLFRLQQPNTEVHYLSFHAVGIPLSVACHFVAVLVTLIGAFRFWRQQNAISRGKVYAGGWDINSVGILLFIIIVATLVLSVVILIQIEQQPGALFNRILRL
ncbi:hypothetical protein N7499_011259 [Penicillium canescens]|nr:hypothetical protein N7522_010921 [Penicillium canescens]KAJ6065644.1 hypothetical protein N7444_001297 [Penicillium canescens]KAJ6069372.1 hypothetical protein N7499_011259 [Penicillium canescens]KAJ6182575.1 hypothetical protein N7485_001217 [Penicillium canescens]